MYIKMNNRKFISNSRLSRLFVFVLIAISSVFLAACEKSNSVQLTGPIMGTQYKITLSCIGDSKVDKLTEQQWHDEVLSVMSRVNQSMSTYIVDSELSLFNASKTTDLQPASDDLISVLASAQRVSVETKGAFDSTVMPAVNLWGFGPVKKATQSIPTDKEIESIKSYVGYDKLKMGKGYDSWQKLHPNVSVDFSAIAKGYAVDEVADRLFELGCENFLVDIGGELQVSGTNAAEKPWRLAIEKPDTNGSFQALLDVTDISVASSGDYKNFFLKEGKRFSHTIDPRTLKPITHNLAAVTVLDSRAQRADALATAFMVMGSEAVDFAENNNIPAYFIFRTDEDNLKKEKPSFHVLYTKELEKFIVK